MSGDFLNLSDSHCGSDLAHSSPHPFFNSPAPLSVHLYRVPLPVCSACPCGMGAGRRFYGALWMHGEQCPELISLILWSVCVVNMRQFKLRERFFARITARCWHPCTFTAAHPPLDPTRVELIIDVLRFQSELVL